MTTGWADGPGAGSTTAGPVAAGDGADGEDGRLLRALACARAASPAASETASSLSWGATTTLQAATPSTSPKEPAATQPMLRRLGIG